MWLSIDLTRLRKLKRRSPRRRNAFRAVTAVVERTDRCGRIHALAIPAYTTGPDHGEWYFHGRPHRYNGPAIVFDDVLFEWWRHGRKHRPQGEGPATFHKTSSGGITEEWWYCGRRHRWDGPAYIQDNGYQEWWVEGVQYHFDVAAFLQDVGVSDADDATKLAVLRMKAAR